MKRGCMQRNSRKEGPDVWQFRWSETRLDGKRLYHKKIVGTVEQYPDEDAARRSVVGLVSELNTDGRPTNSSTMTVAQLCDHFEQRELPKENTWRSHATKKIYKAYLSRWIRPPWQKYGLAEVRTIQVESWLRGLPLAKSSCAKIRTLMSVLFNHACRSELFDRNPIYLVRQSAKRRTPPAILGSNAQTGSAHTGHERANFRSGWMSPLSAALIASRYFVRASPSLTRLAEPQVNAARPSLIKSMSAIRRACLP